MKKILPLILLLALTVTCFAQGDRDKTLERVQQAGTTLDEIMSAPDNGIPDDILGNAECIAIVPSYLKGAFVVGAAYGRGVASCRTPSGWSSPAFFTLKAGSFGFQIGGQAVDLVMVIMNQGGMHQLMSSKFELGADASVAAGPVGRHAGGDTDWKMRAEVLTYSRARGVFAGISLKGSVIGQDRDSTRAFYGRIVPTRTLLTGNHPAPQDAQPFLSALQKYAPAPNTPKPAAAPPPTQ